MEFARVELVGEDVEWVWILFEIVDIENGFGIGKIEAGEITVQAGVGGSKVGD